MIDAFVNNIACAMTVFMSSCLSGAGEEVGKNVVENIYVRFKRLFKKEEQQGLLSEFEKNPDSKILKDRVESELALIILNGNRFSEDVKYILNLMPVDTDILGTYFNTYKKLKHDYTLLHIAITEPDSELNEEWSSKAEKIENKLFVLSERVGVLLKQRK